MIYRARLWVWIMIIACRLSLVISLWLGRMHFILSQTEFTLLKTLMEHHFESKVGRVMCWTMAHSTKDLAPQFQVSDIDLKLHWPPFEIWELINFKASGQGRKSGCGVKGERGKQIVSLKHQHLQCDQFTLKDGPVLMKTISTEVYLWERMAFFSMGFWVWDLSRDCWENPHKHVLHLVQMKLLLLCFSRASVEKSGTNILSLPHSSSRQLCYFHGTSRSPLFWNSTGWTFLCSCSSQKLN